MLSGQITIINEIPFYAVAFWCPVVLYILGILAYDTFFMLIRDGFHKGGIVWIDNYLIADLNHAEDISDLEVRRWDSGVSIILVLLCCCLVDVVICCFILWVWVDIVYFLTVVVFANL